MIHYVPDPKETRNDSVLSILLSECTLAATSAIQVSSIISGSHYQSLFSGLPPLAYLPRYIRRLFLKHKFDHVTPAENPAKSFPCL